MIPIYIASKGLINIGSFVTYGCHQHYIFIPDRLENECDHHRDQYIPPFTCLDGVSSCTHYNIMISFFVRFNVSLLESILTFTPFLCSDYIIKKGIQKSVILLPVNLQQFEVEHV